MKELLITLAAGLVENKDAVNVTVDEPNAEGVVVYHLTVAEEDMGRVIGKQGRIAKAVRTIVKAASAKSSKPVFVEII
ncbi:MAG: KH domain-containing protein [Clostridia bacterium]|nr:KH domain-containing protein [Clostridia bacterium]